MKNELLFGEFVEKLFDRIDISPSQYERAKSHYEAVSKCLTNGKVADDIYVQGSFAYGTVVRPFKKGEDADYDIDLVSQISLEKIDVVPKYLKMGVKKCLEASSTHADVLSKKEGRRCWTLKYAPKDGIGFHMDILPCACESSDVVNNIIDKGVQEKYANTSIAITDKDKNTGNYSWSSGNARGLINWFNDINAPYLVNVAAYQRDSFVRKGVYASIEQVPEQILRSSLQRVIQLLKRHRDCKFDNQANEDDKPISMIITILTARIAEQKKMYKSTVYELLNTVIHELSSLAFLLSEDYEVQAKHLRTSIFLRNKDGWLIPNPVNPYENFADRWAENNNAKAKAFFQWVDCLKLDLLFNQKSSGEHFDSLQTSFGAAVVSGVYRELNLLPKPAPTIIKRTDNTSKPYRLL